MSKHSKYREEYILHNTSCDQPLNTSYDQQLIDFAFVYKFGI